MLTIEPPPRARMCGMAACMRMNGARRFTARMRSQSASGTDSIVPRETSAALFTSTSIRPNSRAAVRMIAWQSSESARFAAMKSARPPASRMPVATASPCPVFVPCTTTAAPSCAKCRAIPLPIPELEPVTTATLSVSAGIGEQHRLDHPALMHRVERLAPPVQSRAQTDDVLGAGEAAREQVEHAFPDWPVVTERSLQPHVLLDERIQVHPQRLWRPAHLHHLSVGPHDPER